MTDGILGASFRDPSGFVFEQDGVLYRQVNRRYAEHYDHLMGSGLYAELTGRGWLVPHEECADPAPRGPEGYRTLRPERIPFVSYPYEWCFGQLRDAADLTLRVQLLALRFGMALKDASAYNVQFRSGRPVFIDTLSFERRAEGAPWTAYRQFCQHFLAPLALIAHRDARLGQLSRVHLDGVPLDLARALLPARAWLDWKLLLHIRVHAGYQRRYAGDPEAAARARPLRRRQLELLVGSLRAAVRKLRYQPAGTAWTDYYAGDSYGAEAAEHRRELVAAHMERLTPAVVWDLGANTGAMSRLASERGARTLAFDLDPACVERSWREVRERGEANLLPLWLDLANPSPALGWALRERLSLLERRGADLVMALALVHHLAIGGNVPLPRVARLLAQLAPHALLEFVPKSDPKVRLLLATREDVFPDYTREGLEAALASCFETLEATPIRASERTLYLLRRREGTPAGAC